MAIFLFCPKIILAVFSFKIEDAKPDLVSFKNQEVEVLLNITDLPSESYFRVAWQKGENKQYFGYIKIDGNWVKIKSLRDDCSEYYHISDTSTNSATLITKIGEEEELTSGIYLLKAHRFTSTCKSYEASENTFEIAINLPTPEPTPLPTPSPTSEDSPSPILTPSLIPTLSPIQSSGSTPSPKPVRIIGATLSGGVLGEEKASKAAFFPWEATEEAESQEATEASKNKLVPRLFLGAGLVFLVTAALFLWYNSTQRKIRP